MNPSEIFIRRPIATSLLMAGIAMFGIVAYRALPVSDLPQADYPTLNVNASLPGADPSTMASAVASPLERPLTTIAGRHPARAARHAPRRPRLDGPVEQRRLHERHAAVHPRPRHRQRRGRRADG